ncbi:SCP2 sterol-binding domain-containing protein [Gilbertella persicaria]|uniref:SCP2 sterol-binding domain-containing protein n=1 Tax=Gilbertella persicaria TaxID=101096 RepID=UPI0022210A37|nr:SCP2 sterol-binding domain-containing protein [Gilbertella persicaria]KAI8063367.1 SCP2 sterol-binding domain-containing protein [Gilbertella persicaria]
MSDIKTPGFQSSEVLNSVKQSVDVLPAEEKAKLIKQVNGIFEFVIKNGEGKTETFTIDLKKNGDVFKGKGPNKADAIINIGDADFIQLATGKLNGQKAYMSGKLKIKGQMMLATKLDTVFKKLAGGQSKL